MKTQIIVIHGGETFDSYEEYLTNLRKQRLDFARLCQKDWKIILSEQLGDTFEVILPQMPNKKNAKYLEWKIWFDKIVPFLQKGSILIGHSLGGIFLAKYIEEEKLPIKIRGLFLVAAPFEDTDWEDSLADFVLPHSLKRISGQVEYIHIYHSKDDPVVPFNQVLKYKEAIPEAQIHICNDRQHFNQKDFPEIIVDIKELVANS